MTVKELKELLNKFGDDEPIWVYEPTDENDPYQAVASVERAPFGEVTIYR